MSATSVADRNIPSLGPIAGRPTLFLRSPGSGAAGFTAIHTGTAAARHDDVTMKCFAEVVAFSKPLPARLFVLPYVICDDRIAATHILMSPRVMSGSPLCPGYGMDRNSSDRA